MLLEFQSRDDPWMAFRTGLLYQELVRNQAPDVAAGRMPAVLPVVLYNGTDPWLAAREARALIAWSAACTAIWPRASPSSSPSSTPTGPSATPAASSGVHVHSSSSAPSVAFGLPACPSPYDMPTHDLAMATLTRTRAPVELPRRRFTGFSHGTARSSGALKLTTALPGTIATTLSLIPGYVGTVPGLTVASSQRSS